MSDTAGNNRRWLLLGLGLAAFIIAADQASKVWLMGLLLDPPRTIPLVTDVVVLAPVWNRGVSFGMFSNHDGWGAYVLSAFAVVVSIFLVVWLARAGQKLVAASLGLVIGGALGNVVDRVNYGAVFDFLSVGVGDLRWPAFNLADSAITIGVLVLAWTGLFGPRDSRDASPTKSRSHRP